jgi:hypothetical protein
MAFEAEPVLRGGEDEVTARIENGENGSESEERNAARGDRANNPKEVDVQDRGGGLHANGRHAPPRSE